jgi:hypothetical protein
MPKKKIFSLIHRFRRTKKMPHAKAQRRKKEKIGIDPQPGGMAGRFYRAGPGEIRYAFVKYATLSQVNLTW